NLCLSDNEVLSDNYKKEKTTNEDQTQSVQTSSFPIGDTEVFAIHSVKPNPTNKSWKVSINSILEGEAEISLYDIKVSRISYSKKVFHKGLNSFTQNAEQLSPGIYILEIKNKGFLLKEKLLKE